MGRIAVFVDAGYLFAQGSSALAKTTQPRSMLMLNEKAVVRLLVDFAEKQAPSDTLLRIYWYDAASPHGPGVEHIRLAESDNVKLRLGVINSYGKQKGVDSLIIADLIELARNRAIDSAVLVSGDDDLRIGVQVAQTFGIRVHLLGIVTKDGEACSRLLLREVDTVTRWNKDVVAGFLSIRTTTMSESPLRSYSTQMLAERCESGTGDALQDAVTLFVGALSESDRRDVKMFYEVEKKNPPAFDAQLLASCRTALGRDLDVGERRFMRSHFQALLKATHA